MSYSNQAPAQSKYQHAVEIQQHRIAYHEALANSWRDVDMRDEHNQNSIIEGQQRGIQNFENFALLTRQGPYLSFLSQGSSDQNDQQDGTQQHRADGHHEEFHGGANQPAIYPANGWTGVQQIPYQEAGSWPYPQYYVQSVPSPQGYQLAYYQQPLLYTAPQPHMGYQHTAPPQQIQQHPQLPVNPPVPCQQAQLISKQVDPTKLVKVENAVKSNNLPKMHIQMPFKIPDTGSQTYGTYESGYQDVPLSIPLPSLNVKDNATAEPEPKRSVGLAYSFTRTVPGENNIQSSSTYADNIQSSPNTPSTSSQSNQPENISPKKIEECEEKPNVQLPTIIEADEEEEEEFPDLNQKTVVKQESTSHDSIAYQSLGLSYANAVKSAPKSSPPVQKKTSTVIPVPNKKQPRTGDKQDRKERSTTVVKKTLVTKSDNRSIATINVKSAGTTKSPSKKREDTPFASKTTFSPVHVPKPILLKEKKKPEEKPSSTTSTPLPPLSPTPLPQKTTESCPTENHMKEREDSFNQKTESGGEEITSPSSSSLQPSTPSTTTASSAHPKKGGKGKKKNARQQKSGVRRNGVEITDKDEEMLDTIIKEKKEKEENEKPEAPPSPVQDQEDEIEARREKIVGSTNKEGFYSLMSEEEVSSIPLPPKVNEKDSEDMEKLMDRLDGENTDSETGSDVEEPYGRTEDEKERIERCVSDVLSSKIESLEKMKKDGPLLEYMTNNIREVIKDFAGRPPQAKVKKPVKSHIVRRQSQAVRAFFKARREETRDGRDNYSRFLTEAYRCLILNFNQNLVPAFFHLTEWEKEELLEKEKMVFIEVFREEGGVKDFLNAI